MSIDWKNISWERLKNKLEMDEAEENFGAAIQEREALLLWQRGLISGERLAEMLGINFYEFRNIIGYVDD